MEPREELNATKKRTVWATNLSVNTTEDILYELFLQAGPIEKVEIGRKKKRSRFQARNGIQGKHGKIIFRYEESVAYSLYLLENILVYGKPLHVKASYSYFYQIKSSQVGVHALDSTSSTQ